MSAIDPAADEPVKGDGSNFNEEDALNKLVAEVDSYISSLGDPRHFLVVENTSDFDLSLTCEFKTFNSAGDLLAAKDKSQNAVGAGTTTIFDFFLDEPYDKSSYSFTVSEEDWYQCVTQNISYESSRAKDKEVVTVTNNGGLPARFLNGYALFFNDGKLVYSDSTYFTDDDNELKPGKSKSKELESYQDYDSFLIVFSGRCDKDVQAVKTAAAAAQTSSASSGSSTSSNSSALNNSSSTRRKTRTARRHRQLIKKKTVLLLFHHPKYLLKAVHLLLPKRLQANRKLFEKQKITSMLWLSPGKA